MKFRLRMMISNLITQESEILLDYFTQRYADYLTSINGTSYAQQVFAYIDKDSPRSLHYQLELMKKTGFSQVDILHTGFSQVDILHKNICFASYCGIK